jgi:lipopolysaccharide/colanic/teichoic acid biosynthesis glycosyltransferase
MADLFHSSPTPTSARAEAQLSPRSVAAPGAPEGQAEPVVQLTAADVELLPLIAAPQLPPSGLPYGNRLVYRARLRSIRSAAAQRAFDLILAMVGLVLAAPLMLLIAVAIRLTSRGPVLFRQPRVGLRGRLFICLKFRTMEAAAEQRLNDILSSDQMQLEAFASGFKLGRDPRVTLVGRLLRHLSLDELPQLVNVLRGEMSVVGPRPVVPQELWRYGDLAQVVLQVRPGMTGPWQVNGRSALSYEQRIRLDVDYALHRSLRKDLDIVARTLPCMVAPKAGTAV